MTSKERTEILTKALDYQFYAGPSVVAAITDAIDAAVAEERKAVVRWLKSKQAEHEPNAYGCGEVIKRGDHIQPPKPRYEVVTAGTTHGRCWMVWDNTYKLFVDDCFNDSECAKNECDRLNKECKK